MFLEHVNFTVSDLQRSIDFYTQLFGFEVRWKGSLSDGRAAAHVGDGQQYLALFEAPEPGRESNDYLAVGVNHFGLVVESLDVMAERLAKLGVQPTPEQDYEPGRRFYFFDPDGVEVELVEYT